MARQAINIGVAYTNQAALLFYMSVLIFVVISGLYSAAVLWWLLDTIKSIFQNGFFMTMADKMLGFILK